MTEQSDSNAGWAARWREQRRLTRERKGDSPERLGTHHTPKRDLMDKWLRSGGVERESRFRKK